ncbi:MAG: transposase [Verrucomicrobia bacterium]|jgi:REP element-mobilizing transposase RayT|nr:transposase [Verrucomicrobiota bacterium]
MARKLRVEYPGAIYHVLNRGDRREPIFRDDADRQRFLETLGEGCGRSGWQVHAYCLMLNHFHLVVETPQPTLVAGMKWFLGTYTGRFNRRHKLFGHLFSGRYKALIVDGSGSGYLRTVCEYVHLNPARAKLLLPEQALREYRWSSWPDYLRPPGKRPAWLRVDRVLGEMGIPKDSAAGRQELERVMEARRGAEADASYKPIRRGWFFGEKALKKELLGQMSERMGSEHYGEERQESQQEKAERVVGEELRRRGWTEAALEERAKGDREKVKIAVRLRQETLVTVAWISERLQMGSVANVNTLLYHWRQGEK